MSDDLRQPIHPDSLILAHGIWHGTIDPRHPPLFVDYLWVHRVIPPEEFAPTVVSDTSPGPPVPAGEVTRG